MWGMKFSFLSNVSPRCLFWSTNGIFSFSILSIGLLNSFHWLQKWMHFVLAFENLKPFSVAHLLILLRLCCSFLSRVGIHFDL